MYMSVLVTTCQSVYLPVFPSVGLPVSLFDVCLFLFMLYDVFLYLFMLYDVFLYICLSLCLPTFLSYYLTI